VWHSAYHDHAARRHESLHAAARYLLANPLRAGLVSSIGAYPYWDCVWLRPGDGAMGLLW
jgi:putative transposase